MTLGERLIFLIHCPDCLRSRFNPGHWLTRSIGACSGWKV